MVFFPPQATALLTAFNYAAGLCLSHLLQYTLVMLYTKADTPLVRSVVNLLRICLSNMSTTNRTSGV